MEIIYNIINEECEKLQNEINTKTKKCINPQYTHPQNVYDLIRYRLLLRINKRLKSLGVHFYNNHQNQFRYSIKPTLNPTEKIDLEIIKNKIDPTQNNITITKTFNFIPIINYINELKK